MSGKINHQATRRKIPSLLPDTKQKGKGCRSSFSPAKATCDACCVPSAWLLTGMNWVYGREHQDFPNGGSVCSVRSPRFKYCCLSPSRLGALAVLLLAMPLVHCVAGNQFSVWGVGRLMWAGRGIFSCLKWENCEGKERGRKEAQ